MPGRTIPVLASILLVSLPAVTEPGQTVPAKTLALAHVTVIDATGAPAHSNYTVVITGNRIAEVGPSRKVRIPVGAWVIDGHGKFVIPGLWDMHTHVFADRDTFLPALQLRLYLANGVTGLRDMGAQATLEELAQWKRAILTGVILGPRPVVAGPLVDGPQPTFPCCAVSVRNEQEATAAVKSLKERGADFIKIFGGIPRAAYFALAEEAKKQGVPFAGHVPVDVGARGVSDAGQASIEHLNGVLRACSTEEDPPEKHPKNLAEILATYSEEKCAELIGRFVRNGTWQDPTLVAGKRLKELNDHSLANDPHLRYIPAAKQAEWDPRKDRRTANLKPEDWGNAQREFEKKLSLISAMRKAGVRFLAGTDVSEPYVIPGFSLHEELSLLVEAGLTPMEALEAATRNPAEFLGKLEQLGTIDRGKIADLVLLDANPLEDIRNTQKIRAVILNGRFLDRGGLDQMLAQVAAAVRR